MLADFNRRFGYLIITYLGTYYPGFAVYITISAVLRVPRRVPSAVPRGVRGHAQRRLRHQTGVDPPGTNEADLGSPI